VPDTDIAENLRGAASQNLEKFWLKFDFPQVFFSRSSRIELLIWLVDLDQSPMNESGLILHSNISFPSLIRISGSDGISHQEFCCDYF
jgi:hypothetical protein